MLGSSPAGSASVPLAFVAQPAERLSLKQSGLSSTLSGGITGCGVVASSIRVLGTRGGSSILSTPIKQSASLVQPGRRRGVASAETRVRISDGAPNFSPRAVSLTEKPRASNAARCGFDSCTASHTPAARPKLNGLSASLPNSKQRVRVPPAASRPPGKTSRARAAQAAPLPRYGRGREFDSRRGLSPNIHARVAKRPKAQVCNTCKRRFKSDRVLRQRGGRRRAAST